MTNPGHYRGGTSAADWLAGEYHRGLVLRLTPAERIHAAATTLETAAAAATPGPWHPEHAYNDHTRTQGVCVDCPHRDDGCDHADCIDGTHGIGGFDHDPDNRWSILTNPALAGPLAALLRNAADSAAKTHALAVADAILRTTPATTEDADA